METKSMQIARLCVLATGIFFLAFGLLRGEAVDVLQKAVRICLECIGIG